MKDLTINDIDVRKDAEGRFCLNDLHLASGGHIKNKPATFFKVKHVQRAIELLKVGNPTFNPVSKTVGRYNGGTWVSRELVYKYAMWISGEFELNVIRTFDSIKSGIRPASTMAALNELTAKIESDKDVASFCGKELAKYRKIKKQNEDQFIEEVTRAQLTLGFKEIKK